MTSRPIPSGCYWGRGCDSELGVNYAEALTFNEPKTLVRNEGQTIQYSQRNIESSEELFESLNISASASAASGAFSGSFEANFASKVRINNYNTYLLVECIVENPELVIQSPKLKEEALKIYMNGGWEAFQRQYGSEYLSGVVSGGHYLGVIEISTKSKTEQEDIRGAISANYGASVFKAEASVEMKRKLLKATQGKEVKIFLAQVGGSGDPIEVTVDEMVDQAVNFTQLVEKHPVPIKGIFESYHRTIEFPERAGNDEFRRLFQKDVIAEVGNKYLSYRKYKENLRYVINHFDTFDEHLQLEEAERQELRRGYEIDFNQIGKAMNKISRLMSQYVESPGQIQFPDEYYQPKTPLPSFRGENMLLKELEDRITKIDEKLSKSEGEINRVAKKTGFPVGTVLSSPLAPEKFFDASMGSLSSKDWVLADGRDVSGSVFNKVVGNKCVPNLQKYLNGYEVLNIVNKPIKDNHNVSSIQPQHTNDLEWKWMVSLKDVQGNQSHRGDGNRDYENTKDHFFVAVGDDGKVLARGKTYNEKHDKWADWLGGVANCFGLGCKKKTLYHYIRIN